MPNKPGNDDRSFGGDREREREVSNESNRATGARQRSARGFASMDRSKQREIASKGGKAAHAKGTAHEFDSGEAREAGRKGGMAVSRNREHMAAITAGLVANSLEPKLPPAGTGLMSSLLTGTLSVFATMNR